MNATRIMWINGILFLAILGISVMIITEERYLPGRPPLEEHEVSVQKAIAETAGTTGLAGTDATELGKVNMFDTIIPLPTRTPTPTPEPPKAPRIEEVTQYWKLSFVYKTMATIQDIKTEAETTIKIGDKKIETYRGQEIPIYLESVNRKEWSATFIMNYMDEKQTRTFKMFD